MPRFVLVHGAWHGAWCWEALAAELEARGHVANAVELPIEDDRARFSDYGRLIAGAIDDGPDTVLVAHSMAGLSVPIAAAERPVRHMVFLAALLPLLGHSLADQYAIDSPIIAGATAAVRPGADGLRHWADLDVAAEALFHDCDPEAARRAAARLRGQSATPYAEPFPLDALPAVPRTYVRCTDDRLVRADWAARAARDRLGVEVVDIEGGHSPMLARPAQLADLLDHVAT